MAHPSGDEVRELEAVAAEVREVFAARGHHVAEAQDVDVSFRGGRARSALRRGMLVDAVREAAGGTNLSPVGVQGGGLDLSSLSPFVDRRFRVRFAQRLEDGDLEILTNPDGGLAADPTDQPNMFTIDQWVFAVTMTDDNQVVEVLVADVVGVREGSPGRLILGDETSLGGPSDTPPIGFQPTDEALDGFETDDDDDLGAAAS